ALSESELAPYREQASRAVQSSFLAEDSEISVLRSGSTARNTKHLVLYGQPTLPHAHGDKLGLWLGAFGVNQLAFGGHYPFIWIGPKIRQWELHSASCNVVLVDGRNQAPSTSIQLEHYEGKWMQAAGMENREVYPGSHYERWVWLIQAPDGHNAYAVDRFLVSGGRRFDYNTHGLDVPLAQVQFEGIESWEPLQGTLAGEHIPLYGQPGYGWMQAIRKAKVSDTVSWTYPYGDSSLKITALNGKERELFCCLGEKGGQEMKKSVWDTYVLLRDEQDDSSEHAASFVTVMEPYEGAPFLQSIQPLVCVARQHAGAFEPVGLCVTHLDGSRDVVIAVHRQGEIVSFRDEAGVLHTTDAQSLLIRYRGGRPELVEAVGFTFIESGEWSWERPQSQWQGTVVSVDAELRQIEVQFNGEAPELAELRDAVGFVDGEGYKKPSPYYIREPRLEGKRLVFRTDITLFRGEEGWQGSEKARVQQGKQTVDVLGKRMLIDVRAGDRFTLRNRMIHSFQPTS
ncbi:MAG: Heparinase family protein, partial [Paenibacillus sp.]|nr:Heparinase family protein [Paenibacillus sp.]